VPNDSTPNIAKSINIMNNNVCEILKAPLNNDSNIKKAKEIFLE
jgi:hypothetical protein